MGYTIYNLVLMARTTSPHGITNNAMIQSLWYGLKDKGGWWVQRVSTCVMPLCYDVALNTIKHERKQKVLTQNMFIYYIS